MVPSASRLAAAEVDPSPPNATGQKPAFPGQTRAPTSPSAQPYRTEVLATLEWPWGLAFLPDARMLVTERLGRLRIVSPKGEVSEPVEGLPPIDVHDHDGLLDVAVDPAFRSNRLIYWSYSDPRPDGHGLAVARGRLIEADGHARLEKVEVLWRLTPSVKDGKYFGGRIVLAPHGRLYVATGDGSLVPGRGLAQRLDGTVGKVVRLRTDGRIPPDNPFVRTPEAKPEIWSLGHRNIQGAALNPWTGKLWTVEHGPKGGDELNIPEAGRNYGWPEISYGIDYSGEPIGAGAAKAGMEQPVYYWDPVIAPSGLAFYDARLFPAWRGSLLVGSLREKHLDRLVLKGDRVVGEERLLTELKERIRDVRVGPEGALYVLTDSPKGSLIRLTPAPAAVLKPGVK